jgi:hypothetical protein
MRVLAVFIPELITIGANAPCQTKKPITKSGKVHNKRVFQESFIAAATFSDISIWA